MIDNPYEWLRQKGELASAVGALALGDDDLENLLWLAPRCGYDKAIVLEAVRNPASTSKLILEIRDRVRTEGKRLTGALVELYKLADPVERERATKVIRQIAESGFVELHREEAKNILRGVEGGYIKPES